MIYDSCVFPELRCEMEEFFQCDFSAVKIHTGTIADRITSTCDGLAAALQHDIFLGKACLQQSPIVQKHIFIHELAHVAQQNRFQTNGRPTSEAQLEEEADRTVAHYVLGLRVPVLSVDDTKSLRAWGPAGHYYTALFVALAAGFGRDQAERIAFFTQMPDLVIELDAYEAGVSWSVAAVAASGAPATTRASIRQTYFANRLTIQQGLHCLTGRSVADETKYRREVFGSIPATDSFQLGLAVHAYGDSFAHQNGKQMFVAPLGHFCPGTSVDDISRHAAAYMDYALSLLEVLSTKCAARSMQRERVEHALKAATVAKETQQYDSIIKACHSAGFSEARRADMETDVTVPWNRFKLLHGRYCHDRMLTTAYKYADDWS